MLNSDVITRIAICNVKFNKMKTVSLISMLLCLLTVVGFGQIQTDNASVEVKNDKELSVNINTFVSQYLSLGNNDSVFSEPYLINYHSGKNNKYLRMGVGLQLAASSTLEKDQFGVEEFKRTDRSITFNYRIGYERRKEISNRWSYHYGFDFVFAYRLFKSSSDRFNDFESTDRFISAGMGPVFGVRFNVNDRIMLWTEASMYYVYNRNTSFTKSGSQIIQDNTVQGLFTSVRAPISINAGIKL